jgi:hypothetical protein
MYSLRLHGPSLWEEHKTQISKTKHSYTAEDLDLRVTDQIGFGAYDVST